jgi:hypothetical protein
VTVLRLRAQAMVLEQLRNELRRRSEETEDERDLLFQRMQAHSWALSRMPR